MLVYYQEQNASGKANDEKAINICRGVFPLTMKIVPEYQVWKGDETKNWNDDSQWRRADNADLNYSATDYDSNEKNTTDNGYVPLDAYTNVIMPTDSKSQLYEATWDKKDGDTKFAWVDDDASGGVASRTADIEFDMLTEKAGNEGLKTMPFRANLCDEIHFMPGATMLHAEMLSYTKAWTDVTVPTYKWTLLSTPLMDVVSGDWYTATSGTQAGKSYFNDITFDAANDSRTNPEVFQRIWNNESSIIAANNRSAAYDVAAWSTAYNDASVRYEPGTGFSLKAFGVAGNNEGRLLFRLPKADAGYDYS